MVKLSIIVPVYNEEEGIGEFICSLKKLVFQINMENEIIVVDDCSQDDTPRILSSQKGIILIRNNKNLGYGSTLKKGITYASGDEICIIDSDNTYSPSDIINMLPFVDHYAMVVGERMKFDSKDAYFPFHQKIAKFLVCAILRLVFKEKISDFNSGLRLIRKDILQKYLFVLPEAFSFTASLTLCMLLDNRKVRYVPIQYFPRKGKTKVQAVSYAINFIKSYAKIICIWLMKKKIK